MERNSRFEMGSILNTASRIPPCVEGPNEDSLSNDIVSSAPLSVSSSKARRPEIVDLGWAVDAAMSMRPFMLLIVILRLVNSTGAGLWKCAETRGRMILASL